MIDKDAYFMAKRQMTEALDYRLTVYYKALKEFEDERNVDMHKIMKARIQEVEEMRNFVRNGMLWENK